MKIYVKNMVCDRCKAAVKGELEKNQIPYKSVELGEIEFDTQPSILSLQSFRSGIELLGFELIDDKKSRVIEKIKAEIIKSIQEPDQKTKTNFSIHLAQKIGKDYSTLSSLFSEVEGTTIAQYVINQKIEKVKELLVYDELTLNEIALHLNYSSVQHLSNQFKKVTGLTPSYFKKLRHHSRKPLDKV
jgi:AraC-like DNA-binding protein